MKTRYVIVLCVLWPMAAKPSFPQDNQNCFLYDFQPKNAALPPFEDAPKTTDAPTVTVTINASDTLGEVSKYIFGNALASWLGNDVNNAVLLGHLQKLSPTLIRYPGGSWSDIFFWNGDPGDLPSTIPDGTKNGQKISLSPQFGMNSWPTTVDNYYIMRDQVYATQGLITINYAYARYGLSEKPVEQAAHYAAEWVRYDGGLTKFWEIGNENAGPWEAGWQIDTTSNKDGQPEIITGELYGKHFKIFADSMRAAAAELDETIYIGGQIIQYNGESPPSWNVADRTWNAGFFREVGDAADFYVIHNYFGGSSYTTVKSQVDQARSEIIKNITFVRQDIQNKQAAPRPIALTEWNMSGPDLAKTSIANGMQAVVVFCEMMKNNFGMSSRWLIANWESDGMFYNGNSSTIPKWNPRPDFFYTYYLQQFIGDHMVNASVTGSSDVLAYATRYSSGHAAVVVVNKGTTDQVVALSPQNLGVGERFYVYSLAGVDDSQWPQAVKVNDNGPSTSTAWGPIAELETIPAEAYPIDEEIKFTSPSRSVQFVLIDNGDRIITAVEGKTTEPVTQFNLFQNYPNPFNAQTRISYALPEASTVTLKLYDLTGREMAVLVDNEKQIAGKYDVTFDATNWPSGVYFYTLQAECFVETRKMVLIR